MKAISSLLLILILVQGCISADEKKIREQQKIREQAIQDSITLIEKLKLEREQDIKDSTIRAEQEIAIGDIQFGISEKECNIKTKEFLKKCEYETVYKYRSVTRHKLGEYNFYEIYGWFDEDKLYQIVVYGSSIKYDEYESRMNEQYESLMRLLVQKYGEPLSTNILPSWTYLNKGESKTLAKWNIGTKNVEVYIECTGVSYSLNIYIYKPNIKKRLREEEEAKKKKSIENAVDIL